MAFIPREDSGGPIPFHDRQEQNVMLLGFARPATARKRHGEVEEEEEEEEDEKARDEVSLRKSAKRV